MIIIMYSSTTTTTHKNSCLTAVAILRTFLLLVLLAWQTNSLRLSEKVDLDPELETDDFIEKPSSHGTHNILWHLMRPSIFGKFGDAINKSRKAHTKMLKKNSDRMSLTALADILSSLKEKYESGVNMRMPSLRFG